MTNLNKAHYEWATRPADQRFWTVEDLHNATLAHKEAAREASVQSADLRVEAVDDQIRLVGRTGSTAQLTSWAFHQLCARAEAPATYLRDLPTTLAVQNLNHGLKANADNHSEAASLLIHHNGGNYARAITSEKYTRIWNSDITSRLMDFQDAGWTTPPARPAGELDREQNKIRYATKAQAAMSLTVKEGDPIGPAGLYASFEDMFAFMVNPERVIVDGSENGLLRGFIVWNSEVGKSVFGFMKFLFRGACGNHIIWDAKEIAEIKIRHIGTADDKVFSQLAVELNKYADNSASEDEARIAQCRRFRLGATKEDVLDLVFNRMGKFLPKKAAELAMDAVVEDVDGDPLTAWGYAQGITRLSQREPNADRRMNLDRAAGKILQIAF